MTKISHRAKTCCIDCGRMKYVNVPCPNAMCESHYRTDSSNIAVTTRHQLAQTCPDCLSVRLVGDICCDCGHMWDKLTPPTPPINPATVQEYRCSGCDALISPDAIECLFCGLKFWRPRKAGQTRMSQVETPFTWTIDNHYPYLPNGFTRAHRKAYIKNPIKCPLCGMGTRLKPIKDQIRPVKVGQQDSLTIGSRAMECELCGVKFYEIYKLTEIEYISKPTVAS